MAFLGDNWRELAPDFESSVLLCDVVDILEGHGGSSANALRHVHEALGKLHPITRDPGAREEYEARRDGTFVAPVPALVLRGRAPARAQAPAAPDPRDALITELGARLAALEQRDAPPPPDWSCLENTE